MKKHIPNLLTLGNLICGSYGIAYLYGGGELPIVIFVLLSGVLDFLDGFVARLLRVQSPIGKDLDSLADMVSFGLLPGLMMFGWLEQISTSPILPYSAFMLVAASAYRLAVFNNDPTQHDSFRGLPTPSNALFITTLPFIELSWVNDYVLVAINILFSMLMISRIELFALKFKSFGWKGNQVRFTFIVFSVLLIALFQFAAIPGVILLYLLTSLVLNAVSQKPK